MRFESIKIENYRQYRNAEFQFPQKSETDIHLILASNGIGKTNLLNAINWCLYGDEPHTSGVDSAATGTSEKLPLANLQALSEYSATGETACPVSVTIEASDGESEYTFTRRATISTVTRIQVGKDEYRIKEITQKGSTKIYEGSQFDEIVSMLLPKKIREYFFFDGEALLNYFSYASGDISHIRDSIYEIAQVNVLAQAEKNLDNKKGQFLKELKKLSPDLDTIVEKIAFLSQNIEEHEAAIARLQEENKAAEVVIRECDNIIRGTEAAREANEKHKKNAARLDQLKNVILPKAIKQRSEFLLEYARKLMLYKANQQTFSFIEGQSLSNMVPVKLDVLRETLEKKRCLVCGGKLNEAAEDYINELIREYNSQRSLGTLIEIKGDVRHALSIQDYPEKRDEISQSIISAEEEIKALQEENAKLTQKIGAVSDLEAIETMWNQREDNRALREGNLKKIGFYESQLDKDRQELAKRKEELDAEKAKADAHDELSQKYDFVEEALTILSHIREHIVSGIKQNLESETMDFFQSLIWKKNTYGRVELDNNFRMKLYSKADDISCLDSCSAAEKELLALAFTLAIHEVSGYENPLFIDTPVGRVSDTNRANFANTLMEISRSKQLILAFTPSEYSSEIQGVLNGATVCSLHTLRSDESTTREA